MIKKLWKFTINALISLSIVLGGAFFLLLVSRTTLAGETLRIAVIDTGLDLKDSRFKLCYDGHKDFTGDGLKDTNGHGTHIAGLIQQYAGSKGYCLVILKFFARGATAQQNISREIEAIKEAARLKVDIINLSISGAAFSKEEYEALKAIPQTPVLVAAGNDGKDLNVTSFYPASYNLANIIPVGALDHKGKDRLKSSNYGKIVLTWEIGENVKSTFPNGFSGYMTGTSQATAVATGKLVNKSLRE